MKKKTWIIVAVIVVLTVGVIGISYALWMRVFQQTDTNLVYSDCFKITFEGENDIHLDKAYSMSDEKLQKDFFLTAVPYHFTITNQCESLASASINLETLSVDGKKIDDQYVNVILYDGAKSILETSSYYTNRSMDLKSQPLNNENKVISDAIDAYSLYNFTLKPNEVREFNLLLFLDENTPVIGEAMEAEWAGKITLSAAYKKDLLGTNTLAERSDLSFTNYSDHVTKIIIQNTMNPVPNAIEKFDESIGKTDTVKSYIVENEELSESGETTYTVYLQANGDIYLPSDSSYLFQYFRILVTIEGMEYFNTSNVTDMHYMFIGCRSLTSLDVSHFDTTNVTNMSYMFIGCISLTSLDVSHFDTSNVTNMASMFRDCGGLTSLDLSNFDTSNVTDMTYMFYECSSLTSLDVSHFDTSNVTNMSNMFNGCSSLTSLDVSYFDTTNVTNMSYMFKGCSGLTNLDVSYFDTTNVTNMSYMFDGCRSLTSLDVSHFDTSNVTSMNFMFSWCDSLTSLNVSHFDTSNVTDMRFMFSFCRGLTSLDVSHFDTSNVTDMSYMFNECSSLTSLDVSHFDTSNVQAMSNMFKNCSNLTTITYGSNFVYTNDAWIDSMYSGCPANRPTHSSWSGLVLD